MVMPARNIVWTKRSQQHIKDVFNYISSDSPKNASMVIEDIIDAVSKAITNPEIYPADKYKIKNDGTYRAFEKHHYRIVYRLSDNVIRVLRVRHTSMEPHYTNIYKSF